MLYTYILVLVSHLEHTLLPPIVFPDQFMRSTCLWFSDIPGVLNCLRKMVNNAGCPWYDGNFFRGLLGVLLRFIFHTLEHYTETLMTYTVKDTHSSWTTWGSRPACYDSQNPRINELSQILNESILTFSFDPNHGTLGLSLNLAITVPLQATTFCNTLDGHRCVNPVAKEL